MGCQLTGMAARQAGDTASAFLMCACPPSCQPELTTPAGLCHLLPELIVVVAAEALPHGPAHIQQHEQVEARAAEVGGLHACAHGMAGGQKASKHTDERVLRGGEAAAAAAAGRQR